MLTDNIPPDAKLLIPSPKSFIVAIAPKNRQFFRHASLLGAIDKSTFRPAFFDTDALKELITELGNSQFPLIRHLDNGKYELHSFFRDFLREKLTHSMARRPTQRLHGEFAARYEDLGDWQQAIHHAVQDP